MSADDPERTWLDLYQRHSRRDIVRLITRLIRRADHLKRDGAVPILNRRAQYENEAPIFQPHRIGHGSQSIVGKFGACSSNANKKRASNAPEKLQYRH